MTGMTRIPRRPLRSDSDKKQKIQYIKDGHIVCPFEGYELLHEKKVPRKTTIDLHMLRMQRNLRR